MAMVRCSQCNAPMTDDEASSGVCPGCGAAVQVAAPTATPAGSPQASAPPPSGWRSAALAIVGALLFFMLPIAMIFYNSMPETTEKKEEKKVAQIKKNSATEKSLAQAPPKKTDEIPPPAKKTPPSSKDASPPVEKTVNPKVESKTPEPRKIEVAKKEEPKKIEKVEPKKVEVAKNPDEVKKVPAPIRQVGNLVFPLLRDDAIKIDGDLSDWRDVPPVFLNAIERGRSPKKVILAPPTQKAYFAYTSRGLLIAVDVVDTSGELEKIGKPARGMWNFWDSDAVEIYIDTLNSRSPRRGPLSIHQFFVMPFGTGQDNGVGGYESKILGRDWQIEALPATGRNALPRAGKKTPSGWTLECLIPRSALREGDAKPGQVFAFEVQIDTGTNIYYFWANDNPATHVSTTPSAWGEIILGGTDARLAMLDAKSQPAKTIAVGDTLTVRVTDRDPNFGGDAKGKLGVTLRAASGDVKQLVLIETAVDSGEYVGTIGTVAKKAAPKGEKLEVLPNDTISLEYLDQVRGNGDRNIVIRSQIGVR